MTFEEAINEQNQAMKTVMETGHSYNYLIVPEIAEERSKFFENYDEKTYNNEDCKKYSSNNEYCVWQILDNESVKRIINDSKRRYK
ncbi:ribonucleotide reductase alpha subunit [Chryseobacterium sp. PvR013]|uniref:hypothetical protein n=1 Tax=Chryseobacterium sp. PvR013 TaxID=2806595 RepID=UPI001AE66A9F|nr:hypothetical protein [Chryseobacterium sp. PvR013]MBP1167219.1 ribonucleotide reductase alpha subunit [Chryseobacterium sp. PvR013]